MIRVVLTICLLLALALACAASTPLNSGWVGDVTADVQRLPAVRFLQVRLVNAARGWTVVESADIPNSTTPAQILAWANARVAWYEQMYAAWQDLKNVRVGTTLTQGSWQVTILAADATLSPPIIAAKLRLTYTPLGISALGTYVITDPTQYTWAAFQTWVQVWAASCAARHTAAMAPVAQVELDRAVSQ
jgi:uncharacterized membrane protein